MQATLLVLSMILGETQAPVAETTASPPPTRPAPSASAPTDQPVLVEPATVVPAYGVAMMEASQWLPPSDPLVERTAFRLAYLTAGYVEDAPRIAELTMQLTHEIRASNRPASPFEIMEAAWYWKRPSPGNVPRKFESFAASYRKWRVEGKKDHAQTLSLMKVVVPTRPPAPPSP